MSGLNSGEPDTQTRSSALFTFANFHYMRCSIHCRQARVRTSYLATYVTNNVSLLRYAVVSLYRLTAERNVRPCLELTNAHQIFIRG